MPSLTNLTYLEQEKGVNATYTLYGFLLAYFAAVVFTCGPYQYDVEPEGFRRYASRMSAMTHEVSFLCLAFKLALKKEA